MTETTLPETDVLNGRLDQIVAHNGLVTRRATRAIAVVCLLLVGSIYASKRTVDRAFSSVDSADVMAEVQSLQRDTEMRLDLLRSEVAAVRAEIVVLHTRLDRQGVR